MQALGATSTHIALFNRRHINNLIAAVVPIAGLPQAPHECAWSCNQPNSCQRHCYAVSASQGTVNPSGGLRTRLLIVADSTELTWRARYTRNFSGAAGPSATRQMRWQAGSAMQCVVSNPHTS